MAHAPLQPGDLLEDRYVITSVQRISGLGALYAARRLGEQDGDQYAIKEELLAESARAERADHLRDFERRLSLLTTFEHPVIPRTFEGFTADESTYLVTEFVEGRDLEDMLQENSTLLPIKKVHRWAIELCDVLHYLHTRKPDPVIFRDLKPANIMIDTRDRIKLVDYGIAGVFPAGEDYPPLGTDGYAAPEQYMGQVTPSVDIYALGATLHHVLTGRDPRIEPPFSFGKRPIRNINPAVPWVLNAIVMRALAYDPWDRFDSAEEMQTALKQVELT